MADDKTEPATPKRLRELREKGTVVRSNDLTAAAVLGVGLFGLMAVGSQLSGGLADLMRATFSEISKAPFDSQVIYPVSLLPQTNIALAMGLFLGALFLVSAGVQLAQVGFQLMGNSFWENNWSRLNPVTGLQQMFSLRKLVMSLQSLAKLLVIAVFAWLAVQSMLDADIFQRPVHPLEFGDFMVQVAWTVGWRILVGLLVIAAIDYGYQKWQFIKDSRMSKDEIKDEFRQQEGSTELKGKLRSRRRELYSKGMKSVRRMLEDVQDSTIIVTNPTHFAVALRYVRGETPAPVVMGKGTGRIAQRIKEAAIDWHVPIMENKPLAQGLYKMAPVGETIPVEFYQAVAVLLAEMYRRGMAARPEPSQEEVASS